MTSEPGNHPIWKQTFLKVKRLHLSSWKISLNQWCSKYCCVLILLSFHETPCKKIIPSKQMTQMTETQFLSSVFSPSATELCPSGHGSSAGSSGELRSCGEELIKKSGSFSLQSQPAFLARVPNETVVRLFSLLVSPPNCLCTRNIWSLDWHHSFLSQMRHYSAKYGVSEFPGEGISFTKLTMDTMNDSSGAEIKVSLTLGQ